MTTFDVPDPPFGAYTIAVTAQIVRGDPESSFVSFQTRIEASRDGSRTYIPAIGWHLADSPAQLAEKFVYSPA